MYVPSFIRNWRSLAPVFREPRALKQNRAQVSQRRFYHRCDDLVQNLLLRCDWKIAWRSEVPVLTITCPNTFLYGQILHEIYDIGRALQSLGCSACHAKIRIYRPLSWMFPLELGMADLVPQAIAKRCAATKDIACPLLDP